MTTYNTILDTLEDEMIDKINSGSGNYKTDPTVKRGEYLYDEVHGTNLCFMEVSQEHEVLFGENNRATISILMYGYTPWKEPSNNGDISDLAMDVIYFIEHDYTYTDNIYYVPKVDIIPGSKNRPMSVFTMELEIHYEYSNSNINN